jgi:hypothetical protein
MGRQIGNATGYPKTPPQTREGAQRPASQLKAERTKSLSVKGKGKKNSSKRNERPGNVLENKGTLRVTPGLSQNVFENKGS